MFTPAFLVAFTPDIIICFGLLGFIGLIVLLHYFPHLNGKGFSWTVYAILFYYLAMVFLTILNGEGRWMSAKMAGIPFYPIDILMTAPLITISKLVLVVLTMVCVLLHTPVLTDRSRLALEYSILILLITEGSLLLLSLNDLSLIFMAMELQTLCLVAFAFVGHRRPQGVIVEAILRYFFNTAYASASFLFGLSILYALVGSLHLETITVFFTTVLNEADRSFYFLMVVGVTLIFYTIFFKLTLVPFHQWVGDLYQGTSGYVGSYFSLVTKIPMLVVCFKLLMSVNVIALAPFYWTLPLIAILSLGIGNIYAFHQPNFRRFWAMASVGHMGQILLALCCFTPDAVLVAFIYLFSYLSANVFIWAVLLHQSARPSLDIGYREFFQKIYRLLSLHDRRLSWFTLFILASLAGVPPTFGFIAKFYLFLQLYGAQNYLLLAIIFFLNLISLANYLRLIRFIFFDNPVNTNTALKEKQFIPPTPVTYAVLVFIFLLHVFFGLWALVLLISLIS
jgi:NADH-quinone oxidoreductase subunit N